MSQLVFFAASVTRYLTYPACFFRQLNQDSLHIL